MRIIETKAYKFDELSSEAKEKAIEKLYDINVFDSFWVECIYEDAKEVGIKIKSFELDRGSYCEIDFIDSAEDTIDKILVNHGECCKTHKTAYSYKKAFNDIIAKDNGESEYDYTYETEQKLIKLSEEFKHDIAEDYRIILSKEYDYMTSEEAIIESIIANEYEFHANGTQI